MKKFEIVADFDGMLTRRDMGNGTSFSVMRDILSDKGKKYSDDMYEYYARIENDFSLTQEERDKYMEEWWQKEFVGIIKDGGVTREKIKEAALSQTLILRDGVKELFLLAKENKIPLLVFSSGVGDVIEMKLEHEGLLSPLVSVVANKFIFDKDGKVSDFILPVVYTGNKNIIAQSIEGKIHADVAFLLGDHPSDSDMCLDANHEKVIRYGFLNGKDEAPFLLKYSILYKEPSATLFPVIENILQEMKS